MRSLLQTTVSVVCLLVWAACVILGGLLGPVVDRLNAAMHRHL